MHDPIKLRDETPPTLEPTGRNILYQIGERRRASGTMKENHLGHRKAAEHENSVHLGRPRRVRRIPEFGVEGEVFAFFAQAG